MANDLLHIKDAYYFEVPRFLWKSRKTDRTDFPPHYVRLDPEYQDWEADRLAKDLAQLADGGVAAPPPEALLRAYHAWRDEHANFASPFDRFLEESPEQQWFQRPLCLGKYAKRQQDESAEAWAIRQGGAEKLRGKWETIKAQADDVKAYDAESPAWSAEKIEQYNRQLDGKIVIPQPFGTLRNNYEPESGFCISKFMILELLVAGLLLLAFRKLAEKVVDGRPARGKLWNLFEGFLVFIREKIALPAIGEHDADRFVPLLWTLFMFILGCNLLGMLPWLGAPTGSFSVTLGLALVTLATVLLSGSKQFGVWGFWKNQVPHMGLPLPLAIFVVPMIFAIEVLGLLIKHLVLGIRLLANMVAGHLVLLAIMGLAVAAAPSPNYWITAVVAVVGSAVFSLLELFVAFLQAYVFTFLSALFIGAAIHHH